MNNSRGKQSSIPPLKTRPDSPVPTLKGPCDRSPKWRGTLRFLTPLEMRPSSITPKTVEAREAPPKSTVSRLLRGTLRSSLRSPAQVRISYAKLKTNPEFQQPKMLKIYSSITVCICYGELGSAFCFDFTK